MSTPAENITPPVTPPVAPPVVPPPSAGLTVVPPVTPPAPPVGDVVYDLKFPENVKVDDTLVTEYKAFAKEHKLDAKGAQSAADLGAKVLTAAQAKHMAEVEAVQAQWTEASKADKEFGGEKFTENLVLANNVLKAYGTPELIDLLAKTGLSQHPEMIRIFHKVGKLIAEDSVALAIASAGSRELSHAERLYGKAK